MAATISIAPLFSDEIRQDPFPYYAELHEHGPVYRLAPGERQYDFLISGFDACSQVLRSSDFMVMDETLLFAEPSWETGRTRAVFFNSMMFTNGPRQARMRHLFSRTFTPRRIEAFDPVIREICSDLLDKMEQQAGAAPLDFMSSFAFPLPATVLGRMLGVADEDLDWYRQRAAALSRVIELGGGTQENVLRADAASVELTDFFAGLVAERRARGRDDLLSALVQEQSQDDDPVTDRELISNLVIVFNAGFVTTVHLLGNGLTLLMQHPDYLDELRHKPALAAQYVAEILRLEGPTHFVVRFATRDTEVAGEPIPRNGRVLVLLGAANRDPARFPHPDVFDPDRPDHHHLAFSAGAHYCMGAALARLEGEIGLNMLLERFPDIALARTPPPRHQLMLRGHDQLWVNLARD